MSKSISSCLNPFEVREVLQVCSCVMINILVCLNPFEVREVLQGGKDERVGVFAWSQSLWSQGGAARSLIWLEIDVGSLNPFEVREVLQEVGLTSDTANAVSIPLKSGRCCKHSTLRQTNITGSQSLWSQGGAASTVHLDNRTLQGLNPFEVREVLQGRRPPIWSATLSLNPFEVREVLQECFTKLPY